MDSLEKKLKQKAWHHDCITEVVELETVQKEVGVVAQQIREKIELAERKETEAQDRGDGEWESIWSGYCEAMEEVLGLLVKKEGDETE